ncbi:MAG: formate dehydrogenase accessory sulfurtransferase FdhD [Hydrotalea sp.]|nr:formate dehydrogenase accessory sulfurtransferase FdhD [Hydrotalea sp.]
MARDQFSEKFYRGDYWLSPTVDGAADNNLTMPLMVIDEHGREHSQPTIRERALTIFLNSQEIVTAMTIGDHPDYLAIGFLSNQKMLRPDDEITAVDVDDDLGVVVVRTKKPTHFEIKSKKKIVTSGCGQGTVFGDIMDEVEKQKITSQQKITTTQLQSLLKKIVLTPSLYLTAGAIHGCVLAMGDEPKIYVEDVGRHNAVDKIAGYMRQHNIAGDDKIFYTTGRLTSEMVIKCLLMNIPILVSRNGFTVYGVELARRANVTMIARARGDRFTIVSGAERILFDKK